MVLTPLPTVNNGFWYCCTEKECTTKLKKSLDTLLKQISNERTAALELLAAIEKEESKNKQLKIE